MSNEKATQDAANAAKTLEAAEVEETPAPKGKANVGKNSGSKRLPTSLTKKLELIREIFAAKEIRIGTEAGAPSISYNLEAGKLLNDLNEVNASMMEAVNAIIPSLGISFEVVEESNVTHKAYNSPSGGLWIYESDLVLAWINADKKDDEFAVKVHAIGTSRENVVEAKTAAWAAAIETYFAGRFLTLKKPVSGAGADIPPSTTERSPQGTGGKTQAEKRLSPAQITRLVRKAEAAGEDEQAARDKVLKDYGKDDPTTMTREEYDEICKFYDDHRLPNGR